METVHVALEDNSSVVIHVFSNYQNNANDAENIATEN